MIGNRFKHFPKQIYIVIGIITNNEWNTLCNIIGLNNKIKKKLYKSRVNILETDLSQNVVTYKKMEITMVVKSSFSKMYYYKITLKTIRNRLYASTEETTKKEA